MAFVAGAITSKLTLDRSKFSASAKAVQKQTRTLGGWVKKNSAQFKRMGLAITAMGAAALLTFKKMVKEYVEVGDWIDKMTKRTGFSATALSELAYAADISGASLNDIEKSVKRMARTITDAGEGLESYLRPLKRLGLNLDLLKRMSPEKQFMAITEAMAALEDPTLRAATAQEIFGRAGTTLLPLMAEGKEGIKKLREEAHLLGIIFDEEAAAKAAALKDAQTALTGSVKGLSIAILEDLIPVITDVTKGLTDWFVSSRKDAKTWAKALLGFFKLIALGIQTMMLAFHEFQRMVFEGGELIVRAMRLQLELWMKGIGLFAKLSPIGSNIRKMYSELGKTLLALQVIEEGYHEEQEKQIDTMTDIIVGFEKFFTVLEKISGGLKNSKKDMKGFGEVITESVLPAAREMIDVFEMMVGKILVVARDMTGVLEKAVSKFKEVRYYGMEAAGDVGKSWEEAFWKIASDAMLFTSSLGSLFNQMTANQISRMDAEYETRRTIIEKSFRNEERKAKAIERLDKEFDKRRKKAMRTQAKRTKAVGIMEAIIHTASAVVEALPNIPLSIAVGILGGIQTALIAGQALPSLAKGGRIGEAAIVGEEGPEVYFPDRPGTIVPIKERMGIGPFHTTVNLSIYAQRLDDHTINRAAEKIYRAINRQAGRY